MVGVLDGKTGLETAYEYDPSGRVTNLGAGQNPFWISASAFGYEKEGTYYARDLAGGRVRTLFRAPVPGGDGSAAPVWSYDVDLLAYSYMDELTNATSIWVRTRGGETGRTTASGCVSALCLVRDAGDSFGSRTEHAPVVAADE